MKPNPSTFGGLPDIALAKATWVILPLPYEATVSYRTGTKFGPDAVLHASRSMEHFDEELGREIRDVGIKTLPPVAADYSGPRKMTAVIEKAARPLVLKGKKIAAIGGEHSVSPGLIRAYRAHYPALRVLHLDAHADLRDSYGGTPFSHACAVRRILETGCPVTSVGIRSMSREEDEYLKRERPDHRLVLACRMEKGWEETVARDLPAGTYFISFDLDFLDPAILPDTGTPEPGGFFWHETMRFLRAVTARKDITVVGFDLVELAPENFHSPACFLVARLLYKLIGYCSYR